MRLPVGQSNFRDIIENGLEFVDKSLLIRDILDDTKVVLITRPRRFGKTLNLSMLQHFFAKEVLGLSTKDLFDNLLITKCDKQYLQHQAQYPVISITFKDIKATNFKVAYESFCRAIKDLYSEHRYLQESSTLHEDEKEIFSSILKEKASRINIESSLKDLTKYLYRHFGVKPIILIDEYDAPVQHAYMHGFYKEMIDLHRNYLGMALKDNAYLFKAVLTGILRISKESLFSDLNNVEVYSLLRPEYGSYFGFTENEVSDLLVKSNLQEQSGSIKDWYNGYQIGDAVIYNPWSIINCLKQKGKLQPYWVNTSDNTLIKDLIIQSNTDFKLKLESLLQKKLVEIIIDERVVFNYLKSDEVAIWNLFLMAGYLKVITQRETDQGTICSLAIPNREVRNLYRRIIETWLSDGRELNWYNQFLTELLNGNVEQMKVYLGEILLQAASTRDMAQEPEAFYHGLMLGLTASAFTTHEIKSNKESGFGFYDIIIIPRDNKRLGIIIELKISKEGRLKETAASALKQILDRQYVSELTSRGIKDILKIGVAFLGKHLEVVYEK
jgi:hypothetical protein